MADSRGWIVPAASDGTGARGAALRDAFDGTAASPAAAVTDRVLTTSLARVAAVGDLFGEPGVAVSIVSFAAEPVGDFLVTVASSVMTFATEPVADFLPNPCNPPSPPSATFEEFLVTSLAELDGDIFSAFSSLTADIKDCVVFRCMCAGELRGDIVPAATDGDGITG